MPDLDSGELIVWAVAILIATLCAGGCFLIIREMVS